MGSAGGGRRGGGGQTTRLSVGAFVYALFLAFLKRDSVSLQLLKLIIFAHLSSPLFLTYLFLLCNGVKYCFTKNVCLFFLKLFANLFTNILN